jgi:uncharacterized LabA/DUF88 family protein
VAARALLFIDGNNWYHSLRDIGLHNVAGLDYAALSRKLVGPSEWLGTRYYIGQVRQVGNTQLYADQRRFLASLRATDRRISCHLGRIEPRTVKSQAAAELLKYLNHLPARLDAGVFHDLLALARRHQRATVMIEKAVDVMLAVDMVVMAERDEFDAAYLLSADGDFTHAVGVVRSAGKRVYVASPSSGAQLASIANAFIRLDQGWFRDCYRV